MTRSGTNSIRNILFGALLLVVGSASFARVSVKTLPELVNISKFIAYGRIVSNAATSSGDRDWVSFEPMQILRGSSTLVGKPVSLCRKPPPMTDYPDISKWAAYEVVLFLSPRPEGCFELSHSYVAVVEVRDGVAQTARVEKQPDNQPCDLFLQKIRKLVASQSQTSATEK